MRGGLFCIRISARKQKFVLRKLAPQGRIRVDYVMKAYRYAAGLREMECGNMLKLIPYPSGAVEEYSGVCRIPEAVGAELGGFDRWVVNAFENRLSLQVGGSGSWLTLCRSPELPEEGYRLTIRESGIRVEASAEAGVVWALTTAANLVSGGVLPCCSIEDAPRYAHRGVNLDCSRHFFPVEEVKRVIEEMSLAKLNVLHWHLADDQGWRIESKRFPKLHMKSKAYYTQSQLRDVVEYALLRGVEVVPEIDLPGHTSAILAAYPQYSCSEQKLKLPTAGGIYTVILCAGKDSVLDFLEELLEEIVPIFPSKRFHIGGDEAPKAEWRHCPHCAARMNALGLTDYEELQGWFTCRVAELLKKHGKTPICWNEVLLAKLRPEELQVQYWTLEHRLPMEKYVNNGGKWIYSDMFETYLDYPHSMSPLKKLYGLQPHLGKKSFADDPGLLGLEVCLWTERIPDAIRLEKQLFPRAQALAEVSWSGAREYSEFCRRLEQYLKGEFHAGLNATTKGWWDPRGSARRKEALIYMAKMNEDVEVEEAERQETAAPNQEFARAFRTQFFKPTDLPYLAKLMK